MSVYEDPGKSEETAIKHDQLRKLLDMHIQMCKRSMCNYWYFDMNAGDGSGSPHIAHTALHAAHYPAWSIVLAEHNPATAERLTGYAARFFLPGHATVRNESNVSVAHVYAPRLRFDTDCGIVFHDPNGVQDLQLDALRPFARTRLDVLIYYSATAHKRAAKSCYADKIGYTMIEDILRSGIKTHWLVRAPRTRWQWTFIIGTNWSRFPSWKKAKFYALESPEGRAAIERCQYTTAEQTQRAGQEGLGL